MKKILLVLIIALISSCSVFNDAGTDLGDGLMTSFEDRDSLLSAIGGSITKGAVDSIDLQNLMIEINTTIDTVLANAGSKTNRELTMILDSALGKVLNKQIEKLGATSKEELGKIRNELLGKKTLAYLANMRNELLGDSTKAKAAELRDELLGEKSSKMISNIVAEAMDTLMVKYQKFQPMLSADIREESSFFKKNFNTVLWTAGGIIAGLLVLCYLLNRKRKDYRGLTDILTYEIHNIPNKKEYDELTSRIQKDAQKQNLEPKLRKVLAEKGLLESEKSV